MEVKICGFTLYVGVRGFEGGVVVKRVVWRIGGIDCLWW